MGRLQSNCLIAAVAVVVITGGLTWFFWGDRRPEPQPADTGAAACPQALESTITTEDFSSIPQDVAPFASTFHQAMSTEAQRQALWQFTQHYFAPWQVSAPLFEETETVEGIQELATKTWYGENRQPVEAARVREVVALADLQHFPSMDLSGVVIKPVFIRVLPTIHPLYESPEDFPFDQLQFAELKVNEPVHILHASKDGAWLYVETSYANGWVEPDAVRLADATLQNRIKNAEQVVVVRDFPGLTAEGRSLPQPKIGTLYPLVREEADAWLVETAVAGDAQHATLATARLAKQDGRRHPLPMTSETLTLVGNQLLKTPYGWGELYRNRDCSATTRDFFLTFGIWLPRNSLKQITSGPQIPLDNLSAAEKENRIREQAVPFRTLLHLKGHIMLYVGQHDQKPVVLHTIWGLHYKYVNCPEQKIILGRTVLSTLEAGMALPLVKGTLLERLDAMLLLPVPGETLGEPERPTPSMGAPKRGGR